MLKRVPSNILTIVFWIGMFSFGLIFASFMKRIFDPFWLAGLATLFFVGGVCSLEMKKRDWV